LPWLEESWQIGKLALHGIHLGDVALSLPTMWNVKFLSDKTTELRASVAATWL